MGPDFKLLMILLETIKGQIAFVNEEEDISGGIE